MTRVGKRNSWFVAPFAAVLLSFFAGVPTQLQAQPFPVVRQPLIAWVVAQKHAPAETLENFLTSKVRLESFDALVSAMAERDWEKAGLAAQQLRYLLVTFREAGNVFVAASDGSGVDPIVVVNIHPKREVIVQAPHVPYERGTAEQAIVLLRELGARAAIISGAHRCASKSFTMCSGVTSVCSDDGSAEGFRDSDVSHNAGSLFHRAHVGLAEKWPNAVVLSLHGMRNDKDGFRTSFIISNGIQADDEDRSTPATKLRYALAKEVEKRGRVVSCNVQSDSRYEYRFLCGFTNVQGRHLNGSENACRAGVTRGTGRFIHIEQDRRVLEPYHKDWARLHRYPVPAALRRSLSAILPEIAAE